MRFAMVFRRFVQAIPCLTPHLATCLAALLCVAMAGCTSSAPTSASRASDAFVTHAIPAHLERDGLAAGDVEVLKARVASAPEGATDLAWSNGRAGASGSIKRVASFKNADGRACRRFSTTIQSFMGVSLFEGETCRVRGTTWILSKLRKR